MAGALSFVGWSDSGKTTLVSRVVSELKQRHVRVAVIKHAHHGFDVDKKGSDSDVYQKSGADAVMLASPFGMVLMRPDMADTDLAALMACVSDVDLILTEGFKKSPLPKIEVYRKQVGKPPLSGRVDNLIALVTDDTVATDLPVFSFKDVSGIADFIQRTLLT